MARASAARAIAMSAMLIVLVAALRIFFIYDATTDAARFALDVAWMPSLGIRFHVAVDGFNIYLLLVAALLFPVALAASWTTAASRRPLYLALLLILQTSLLGAFVAQNLVLFFVYWETVLIPMGILILVFGGRERRAAAMTFFMYTLAGSVLLLAAVIALGAEAMHQTGQWSFELGVLYGLDLDPAQQMFVFVAIVLACLVKCPLAPFHSWLIPAYYEAPPVASALMSGAMSKLGAFGLLKLALPLAPDAAAQLAPYLVALAVFNIVYGALLALREKSYKKLVAYASLSHMGYIVLGIFSFEYASIQGSMLQMLSHAMVTAGLFLILGMLEQQRGPAYASTTALASSAPRLAVLLTVFVLTSVAVPLTSGFAAEFLILFGAFAARPRHVAGRRRRATAGAGRDRVLRDGARRRLHAALHARTAVRQGGSTRGGARCALRRSCEPCRAAAAHVLDRDRTRLDHRQDQRCRGRTDGSSSWRLTSGLACCPSTCCLGPCSR